MLIVSIPYRITSPRKDFQDVWKLSGFSLLDAQLAWTWKHLPKIYTSHDSLSQTAMPVRAYEPALADV